MKNSELRYPLKMLVLICFIVKLDKEIKLIVNFKFFSPFIENDRRFFIFSISCPEFAGNWKSEGIFYSLQCEKKEIRLYGLHKLFWHSLNFGLQTPFKMISQYKIFTYSSLIFLHRSRSLIYVSSLNVYKVQYGWRERALGYRIKIPG